jgi:hypothetical protein
MASSPERTSGSKSQQRKPAVTPHRFAHRIALAERDPTPNLIQVLMIDHLVHPNTEP